MQAQGVLYYAERQVHNLDSMIQNKRHQITSCDWYNVGCDAHKVFLYGEIDALIIAKKLAHVALVAAHKVLSAIQNTAQAADSYLNDKLKAAYRNKATAQSQMTSLHNQQGLSQKFSSKTNTLHDWVSSKSSSLFRLHSMSYHGSLAATRISKQVKSQFRGVFFGKPDQAQS